MSKPIAKKRYRWLSMLVCSTALGASTLGCDRAAPIPGFMPSWDEARQSLESSLSAWRDAPTPLPSSFNTGNVQYVDKKRQPNQRLLAFQILSQTDIENARQFTVRLTLDGEESPQLVKYNILGRNPVWVFRLEDYEMFAHWEDEMDAPAPGSAEKLTTKARPAKAN
jgi:hypothetical protein